jgi:hypothetical protein
MGRAGRNQVEMVGPFTSSKAVEKRVSGVVGKGLRHVQASRTGIASGRSAGATTTMMSMVGLEASPGTLVEPTSSMPTARVGVSEPLTLLGEEERPGRVGLYDVDRRVGYLTRRHPQIIAGIRAAADVRAKGAAMIT